MSVNMLEASHVAPACPSDRSSMKMTLEWWW